MIKVTFVEPTSDEWKQWRDDCRAEQKRLDDSYESGSPIEVKPLYKEMKSVYLSLNGPFHGKCVYCESLFAENQPGDIDHFRPKGRVQTAEGESVMTPNANGASIPHIGYYWLAYDWRNLLPACADCNRPSSQKTQGKRIGKWDQFPIELEANRATRCGEEGAESPLLLNPTDPNIDPSDHLNFDELGIVAWNSPQGEATVRVFGLNDREALVKSRRDVYSDVLNAFGAVMNALHSKGQSAQRSLDRLMAYRNGTERFSAVGRVAIREADSRQAILRSLCER
jgi:hypothetical protein